MNKALLVLRQMLMKRRMKPVLAPRFRAFLEKLDKKHPKARKTTELAPGLRVTDELEFAEDFVEPHTFKLGPGQKKKYQRAAERGLIENALQNRTHRAFFNSMGRGERLTGLIYNTAGGSGLERPWTNYWGKFKPVEERKRVIHSAKELRYGSTHRFQKFDPHVANYQLYGLPTLNRPMKLIRRARNN